MTRKTQAMKTTMPAAAASEDECCDDENEYAYEVTCPLLRRGYHCPRKPT
jgi:hypothetical protein